MHLRTEDYHYVEFTHNLASHAGSKVGRLELNAVVKHLTAYYQVVHNGVIIKEVDSSREAAETYNKVLSDNGITE